MTTLAAGASANITLAAGNEIRGAGAGSAVIGRAATVKTLTAGDAWRIGPFLTTQAVSITAASAITYEVVARVTTDPSPADTGFTAAQVAALASGAGNIAGQGGLKAGTLIDGDSLGDRNQNALTLTALTRSGTTGSATATGLAPPIGSRIKIGNVTSDTGWNGFWTVTGLSGSTATFTVPATLDAAPTSTRTQMTVTAVNQRVADADYNWAEMHNGVNYTLIENVAIGGRILSEINEDFDRGPGLYVGCLIDFNGGTNDVYRGIALALSSAAMEAYIVKAIAKGHRVLINTVPPMSAATNTTAIEQATASLNKEFKRLALKYQQPLYDKFAALVDPATADFLAGNFDSTDGIHLSPTGARICGMGKAPIYAANVPTRRISVPATISDTIATITTSSNILSGFFAGTGGSGGAGSIATGWALAPTTLTVTGSKGTGAVGATQILTLSGASGSFTFNGPDTAASVVAGGRYELVGKVALANFAAGLRLTSSIATTINGVSASLWALAVRNANSPLPIGDVSMTFRSEPFTVPAGATVALFQVKNTGVTTGTPGGTETITFESWALNRLD